MTTHQDLLDEVRDLLAHIEYEAADWPKAELDEAVQLLRRVLRLKEPLTS